MLLQVSTTTATRCVALAWGMGSCTIKTMFFADTVMEPFIPPEGDGRASTLTKEGLKERYNVLEKKGRTVLGLRKIRRFEEEFDAGDFALTAQDIYIEAHDLLVQ